MIAKRRTNNFEISSYLSLRQQINLNNSALTPTIPPSVPKKSVENNKLSNNLITPSLNKKNTLSVIKPHSSKYSIEQRESKINKQANGSEVSKKTMKHLDKECEEIIKSKIDNPKPISINLALKKVYNTNNTNNSDKNSCSEIEKSKKKQINNYSSNQANKLTSIINEFKSNEQKNYQMKNNAKKINRKNMKSSTVLCDLTKNKDISLVEISLNQISMNNSGILTNRTARLDLKNYQSVNGGSKIRDVMFQNTSRLDGRKFPSSKPEHFSCKKIYSSTNREGKNYNKIPKNLKIDLNDFSNDIVKKIKI